MFGISYFKGQPSHYIQKYVAGIKRQAGPGLPIWKWRRRRSEWQKLVMHLP